MEHGLDTWVFIGSLTQPAPSFAQARGLGLTVARFDADTGGLTPVSLDRSVEDCTWLVLDAAARRLYATCERPGSGGSALAVFEIDTALGRLAMRGHQSTGGQDACHATLLPDGSALVVANYNVEPAPGAPMADVALHAIGPDAALGPAASYRHDGQGPDTARQTRPHAHHVACVPGGRGVFVTDLGCDRLVAYEAWGGQLLRRSEQDVQLPAGSGPRHLVFAPDGLSGWVVHELTPAVTTLRFDAGTGRWVASSRLDIPGASHPSGILLSRDGRWLLVALRLSQQIWVGAIDAVSGALLEAGRYPCGGNTPRDLMLSADDRHLLVANQDSDTVSVLRFDSQTGQLSAPVHQLAVGTPMSLAKGAW